MAVTLPEFLNDAAGKPFEAGRLDCMLFAADWVALRTGKDPAAPFRGAYRTVREYETLLKENGGLLAMAGSAMTRIGLQGAEKPQEGDVGVIRYLTPGNRHRPLAGIYTGLRWVAKTRAGIVAVHAAPIAVWRV